MQLHYLETHLVDHCDLKCKGCGHFSSLSEKRYADFDVFKKDFVRLSGLFDNISRIRLMGGEPLLHPDVPEFLRFTRHTFPNAEIFLVTNALRLCRQPERFWEECSSSRIIIQITRYPIKLDLEAIKKNGKKYDDRLKEREGTVSGEISLPGHNTHYERPWQSAILFPYLYIEQKESYHQQSFPFHQHTLSILIYIYPLAWVRSENQSARQISRQTV